MTLHRRSILSIAVILCGSRRRCRSCLFSIVENSSVIEKLPLASLIRTIWPRCRCTISCSRYSRLSGTLSTILLPYPIHKWASHIRRDVVQKILHIIGICQLLIHWHGAILLQVWSYILPCTSNPCVARS